MLLGIAAALAVAIRVFWKKRNVHVVIILLIALLCVLFLIAPAIPINFIGWWRDLFVMTWERLNAVFSGEFNFNMPNLDIKR